MWCSVPRPSCFLGILVQVGRVTSWAASTLGQGLLKSSLLKCAKVSNVLDMTQVGDV